jgi:hypothetical protein
MISLASISVSAVFSSEVSSFLFRLAKVQFQNPAESHSAATTLWS